MKNVTTIAAIILFAFFTALITVTTSCGDVGTTTPSPTTPADTTEDYPFCKKIREVSYGMDSSINWEVNFRWDGLKRMDQNDNVAIFNSFGEYIREEYTDPEGTVQITEYEYTNCDNFCKLIKQSDYIGDSLTFEKVYSWNGNTQVYKDEQSKSKTEREYNSYGYLTKETYTYHPMSEPGIWDTTITNTNVYTIQYTDCDGFCKEIKSTYAENGEEKWSNEYTWDGLLQVDNQNNKRTLYNKQGYVVRREDPDYGVEVIEYIGCD